MTNANKAKGTRFEVAVRTFLAERFGTWRVRRPQQEGYLDVGDLHVEPSTVIQAKDHAKHDLSGWLRDVEKQRANAHAEYGVVIAKRRQRPIGDSYVVMTLTTYRELLTALQPPAPEPAPAADEPEPTDTP